MRHQARHTSAMQSVVYLNPSLSKIAPPIIGARIWPREKNVPYKPEP